MSRHNFTPVEVLVYCLTSERPAHTREVLLDPSHRFGWCRRFDCWLLAPFDRSHWHNRLAAGVHPEWQAHTAPHLSLSGLSEPSS
jgi:hypothetical protein